MSSNPFDNDYDNHYTKGRGRNYPRENALTEEEKIQRIMQEIDDSEARQLESTRRALASIDDSERVGVATAEELMHQREQLNNIEGKTTKINQDLKTSQKHITNINSIFGGIKNWWYGDKDKDKDSKSGAPKTSTSRLQDTVERSNASRPHPGERLRTDDGRGFYEEEEDLDSQFMRGAKGGQNQYFKPVTKSRKEEVLNENLDMMSSGMSRLKGLAQGLGDEIESQNEQLDRITVGCLLMLMDSPLNRAWLLQVYIHTEKNVLIEVNPQTRIPRTFDRFCGLMVQLLHKLSIHAADGPQKLLKVVKNPVTDHLPIGCKKIGMSFHSEDCIDARTLVPPDEPVVLVVGAMAHGSIDPDYTEETYSISNYPLSAALTCAKLCTAFEEKWGVV